jgi:hypothetical protein
VNKLIQLTTNMFIGAGLLALGIWLGSIHDGFVIYRCDWSEISPDVPIEVKNECRKRILQGRI